MGQNVWIIYAGENEVQETDFEFGNLPNLIFKPVAKPRLGDVRSLVLPGGGDMVLRIWSAVRNWAANIFRWRGTGATHTPAYRDAIARLTQFSNEATELFTKAWSILDAKVCLRLRCEIHFFLDVELATAGNLANGPLTYPCIAKCIFEAVDIARARGRNLAHEARLDQLAINLRNGAGPAHRLTNVDN